MTDCVINTMPYELEFVAGIPNALGDDIVDNFTRSVSSGLGTATSGQTWTTSGGTASDYNVNGSAATFSMGAVNAERIGVLAAPLTDVDIRIRVSTAVLATGAPINAYLLARYTDANNHYRARLAFNTDQTISVALEKRVAGVTSAIGLVTGVSLTHVAGVFYWLRFQVIGSKLRVRAWRDGTPEGVGWFVNQTDTTFTGSGNIGMRTILSIGNSNTLPVVETLDSLLAYRAVGANQNGVATPLLSLHTAPWCVVDGTRLDSPTPRYAEASSMLTDGSTFPAVVYNNRVLELRLAVQAATPDLLAADLQELARQLHFGLDGTGRNILRFADKTSESVYFRTFRVSPADIDISTRDQRIAFVNIDIPAEPFAYGPREFYQPMSVLNDPVTGAGNHMFFDLTGVKGDVDTPLTLVALEMDAKATTVIAVRRRGTPANTPFAQQAESGGLENATLQPNDPQMSGPGNNYIRAALSFVGNSRVLFSVPPSSTVDGRGDYRAIIRVRRSNNTADIEAQIAVTSANQVVSADPVVVPKTTNIQLVDLGVIALPTSADPVYDGYSGQQVPIAPHLVGVTFTCTSTPVTGCGTIDMDYLLLTPADDAWLAIRWTAHDLQEAGETVIDGVHEAVWFRNSLGALVSEPATPVVGGFPYISPDATNRIYFVRNVGLDADGNGDAAITDQTLLIASYWPRYLDPVRPTAS